MAKVRVLVFSGYGINCEEETAFAFHLAKAKADIVHINDLIEKKKRLNDYQILVFPGGFSYGDDTGAGKAFANRLKNHLAEELNKFFNKDRLVLGICNGFQILTYLGIFGNVALVHNNFPRYLVRWVDLKIENKSPWLTGIKTISLPIAHGEGKFFAPPQVLKKITKEKMIALTYFKGEICRYQNLLANPNGSLKNVAGITDSSGKILGLMPHPERAIFFTHLPHWNYLKEKYQREGKSIPRFGPGLKIFENAVKYFSD